MVDQSLTIIYADPNLGPNPDPNLDPNPDP